MKERQTNRQRETYRGKGVEERERGGGGSERGGEGRGEGSIRKMKCQLTEN